MSKKNKKKFKRNKLHLKVATATQTTSANIESTDMETGASDPVEQVTAEMKKPEEDPYTHNQYDHVKKDVRKILFIIAILALVFAVIIIVSAKTTILASFGDWIYKIANIQTQ